MDRDERLTPARVLEEAERLRLTRKQLGKVRATALKTIAKEGNNAFGRI